MTLIQYWDAVEADFQRYYGTDLRHEIGTIGVRRLYALVKNLPPDAALWRSMPQPEQEEGPPMQRNVIDMRKKIDPNVVASFFKNKVGDG